MSSSLQPSPTSAKSMPQHTEMTDSSTEDVEAWDEEEIEAESVFQADETAAFIGSMLVHLIVILSLALVPLTLQEDEEAVVIVSPPPTEKIEKVEMIEEVTYSDLPQEKVGANSMAEAEMAEASAEMFAEMAEIPNPVEMEPTDLGQIMVNKIFSQAVAPLDKLENQKGKVGQGTTGAAGAVHRITFQIMQSLEERPTLVVWLFDQSGSLHRQRREIRDRFDRIYEELGIAERSGAKGFQRKLNEMPLATSIIGFGSDVKLFTEDPTDDLSEIKNIVNDIPVDSTGQEKVFSAIETAAKKYETLTKRRGGNDPQRNVLFVVVTDERGDDMNKLESAVKLCKKASIPVYVIGVPAPFGRQTTLVKYVDPDPKYDQTPSWAEVDQGPETLVPELVRVGFTGNFGEEPAIDSGFGPYGLTRLCYETGGIYFTVHPNRNTNREVRRREIESFASDLKYFFDPTAMARYRPDYLSPSDYMTMVKSSPLRQALVNAAQMQPATGLSRPQTRFVKRSEPQLVADLTKAQQDAAKLEPMLNRLAMTLEPGMKHREAEKSLRWRAGYDLAMGRVLAQKVRTEAYNAMLAKGKRGMPFKDKKNNTWVLEPSEEISVGSKWQREADTARELLTEVKSQHQNTPWGLLATQELEVPIGWTWKEVFTDLSPARNRGPGNNNNNPPRPGRDDEKRMLKKAPKRPVPKL